MRADAVVLCGGGSRRMGVDKTALVHDGRSLLEIALRSVDRAVCVGPPRATSRPVQWTREDPVGSGPVAALAAGLALVRTPVVVLLAADLPLVTAAAVAALLPPVINAGDAAAPSAGSCGVPRVDHAGTAGWRGTVAVDDVGREQWLLSAWSVPALREALATSTSARLRDVLGPLCDRRVVLPGRAWLDCDTPDEWADLRRTGGREGRQRDPHGRVGRRGAA